MEITVVGHCCFDVIHLPGDDGSRPDDRREQPGGIMYSVIALANLLGPSDTVHPVFGVGTEEYDTVIGRLSRYANVDTGGIFKVAEPTNTVHLYYQKAGNRIECSRDIQKPIPFTRIKSFLNVDGVFINMVSGFDISLETLDEIRMETRERGTPIHFDFHSLTLGIDAKFERFRRPVTDWRRWCFMVSSIQMNEEEAAGLTSERFNEDTLVNHLMPLMVNSLLITRGGNGVTLIRRDHKRLIRHDIPGRRVGTVDDPTGCGDVFGAAFLKYSLSSGDPLRAAEEANAVAAFHATQKGPDGLDTMGEFLSSLSEPPPQPVRDQS
ncbi:MAG: carbohydrate kinase family protein [Bacteroidota bacterium]